MGYRLMVYTHRRRALDARIAARTGKPLARSAVRRGSHREGVAGVYNRAAYAAQKRQALVELRGEHVASLVAGSKPRLRHAQKASLTKARQSGTHARSGTQA
jgi:hypothetical protein